MNLKGIIFGKQQLVLNSAKNKFAYNEEEKINKLISLQNILDDKKSLNNSLLSSQTQPLSTSETRVSSARNSKESLNSNGNDINNQLNSDERIKAFSITSTAPFVLYKMQSQRSVSFIRAPRPASW